MKEYMESVSVADAIKAGRNESICWDCKKALTGGCCWTDTDIQKPVPGWTAQETPAGYLVHDCPRFVRETYGYGRYRTADDYILALEIGLRNEKQANAKSKKAILAARSKNKILRDKLDRLTWYLNVHNDE